MPYSLEHGVKGRATASGRAREVLLEIGAGILWFRNQGRTFMEIAHILNREGYRTRRGFPWGEVQVARAVHKLRVWGVSPEQPTWNPNPLKGAKSNGQNHN